MRILLTEIPLHLPDPAVAAARDAEVDAVAERLVAELPGLGFPAVRVARWCVAVDPLHLRRRARIITRESRRIDVEVAGVLSQALVPLLRELTSWPVEVVVLGAEGRSRRCPAD